MSSYSHLPFDPKAVLRRDGNRAPWVRVDGSSSTIVTANAQLKINIVPPSKENNISPYFFGTYGWYRLTVGDYEERLRWVSSNGVRVYRRSQYIISGSNVEFGAGFEFYLSARLNAFVELGTCVSLVVKPAYTEWIPMRLGLLLH